MSATKQTEHNSFEYADSKNGFRSMYLFNVQNCVRFVPNRQWQIAHCTVHVIHDAYEYMRGATYGNRRIGVLATKAPRSAILLIRKYYDVNIG